MENNNEAFRQKLKELVYKFTPIHLALAAMILCKEIDRASSESIEQLKIDILELTK